MVPLQSKARQARSSHRRRLQWVAGAVTGALTLTFAFAASVQGAAAVAPETIWGAGVPTAAIASTDRQSVELGTKFSVDTPGKATGVRFFKFPANTGPHTGTLWSSSGEALARASFANETESGWQTALFATPVTLEVGESYTVSYFAPAGGYAFTQFFQDASKSDSLSVAARSGVYKYSGRSAFPTSTWRSSQYWVDVTFVPAGGSTASPSATARPTTTAPSATASPTPPTATTPTKTPTAAPTDSAEFPSASNTGVPAGTSLTPYTGPCTITTANTAIDAKTINCTLSIRAQGVEITRSRINGSVDGSSGSSSFTISDSEINVGNQLGTGLGNVNYTARRVHITGGNRSANCDSNCTIEDSYVHGQFRDDSGKAHESGIRMSQNTTLRHNTITCDAPNVPPDAGCSAGLTGYGDFATVQNNLIENNLFKATTGGYCAYGGSSQGKPYSSGTNNIRFINNVFERGRGGKCGTWGPITSFDSKAPGNAWSGNVWDDGTVAPPAN